MPLPALTEPQIQRYARHVLLPDVGGVGQRRLLAVAARVDLDGDLAAAVAAATYLAAAGVGTLVLGGDAARPVTAADVARAVALGAAVVAAPLAAAVAARLGAINPDVVVRADEASTDAAPMPAVEIELPALPGAEVADALVRGGAAAARLVHHLATTPR